MRTARPAQAAHRGGLGAVASRNGPPGRRRSGRAQADSRGERSFPPSHVCAPQRAPFHLTFLAFLAAVFAPAAASAAPPGAVISNQASVVYLDAANQPTSVDSNLVELTTAVVRSSSAVTFTRVTPGTPGVWTEPAGPSSCLQGGAYVPLADPELVGGSVIDPATPQDVNSTAAYNLGEPVFIRLADSDQNIDYQVIDTAVVTVTDASTGDTETVRLSETGPDTGTFAGYLPTSGAAPVSGDCVLQGAPKSTLLVNYTDPADGTDSAQDSSLFDPVQRVFESQSGAAVDGATIELVDATSGLPATVYGNDGVSIFPSAIVSGGVATDSGGTSYVFGPGEYRFPVVPDGNYRIIVTPPPAYTAPSIADPNDLQALPGAPYSLGDGSFGRAFTKSGELSFAFDVPLDPRADALFLQKRSLTTTAAPGDFVRFELTLENTSSAGIASNVRLIDDLPGGMRYIPGSATVNGSDAPDPIVSGDQRQLEFNFVSLDAGARVSVAYVVEIVGGARNQDVVNRATAFANGGLVSNEATAAIRLTEDLFRSTGTIIGRVVEGDCSQDAFSEEQGVGNVRVYLEDGRYAVTDAGGRFHFEGLRPGTHVAQLDTFTVPDYFDIVGCDDAPGHAGRADSQFVKLTRGSLLRADFYLRRKPAPEGRIDLELISKGTDSAEQVAYELTISGVGNVQIRNIDVMVLLPDGVSYRDGTMRIDGEFLGDPRVSGPSLSMALPDRIGSWSTKAEFIADIASHVSGELATKAIARFDSPIAKNQRTPSAETIMVREPGVVENAGYVLDLKFAVLSDELSAADRQKLDKVIDDWRGVGGIRISAVGHTDSQRIAPRNRHIFADNYALSEARANSAAAYIADGLGLAASSLQVAGRGADEPVADNASAKGRAQNRRVELVMSGLRPSRPSFLEVTKASSGQLAVDTKGEIPGTEVESGDAIDVEAVLEVEPPIESLEPGVALLLPEPGFAPAIPAIKVSAKHEPGQDVSLWINDEPVNPLTFDSTTVNAAGTVAVSRWRAVQLAEGANDLRVIVSDADGTSQHTLKRRIVFAGAPVRAEIVEEQSSLVADGKTRPVVAVRLFDRSGRPSRRGLVGSYRVNAPFRSWWEVENERANALVQVVKREPSYRIGVDGIARIELEPTTQTGEVTLQMRFENNRQQELRAWLEPAARDWILVGFAEGTAGYNTLSDNVVAARDAGFDDEYFDDGRVAFFAKGQIRGDYLLTIAYDSDRERAQARNAFETVIDPNAYYPLYADTSEQRFEAPSQRKLYVKLERGQYFALFGDFDTGLSVTDLARYQRRFNGLQSEFRGEHVGFTAFAAESSQAFMRDELRGDGTSGLYRLSNAPIIANSEQVRIEVRDRFDSGQVLETTTLARFLDYTLDTLTGTLFFKKPVPGRDLNFNPVFIVVEYETATAAEDDIVAGGRASVYSADRRVEIGVTHVNDDTIGAEAELSGVDLRWQLSDDTELRAEIARTDGISGGTAAKGSAHSIELEHTSERVDVRAYMREVEEGFGLGYQSSADRGFRRLGVDGRWTISERWKFDGEAGWQQNLATEDIRNLVSARLRYERATFSSTLGITHADDRFEDGDTRTSDLVELGVSQQVFDGRITLRANASSALNDDAASLDFPTRYVFGADYGLTDNVDLVAEYEESEGRDVDASMTRVGARARPWARAQLDTSLTNQLSEFGPRLYANVGFVQGFQLGERWLFDVGIDQSNTLTDATARQFDDERELVSGSTTEDYLAIYTGAMYSAALWSANARIEFRNSDSDERSALMFGWYRQPVAGHGLSAGLTAFRTETEAGNSLTKAALKFGWAYRRANSRWTFFDRLDLVHDDLDSTAVSEGSWRLINNFNANRRLSAATQLSLQYAFKYVDTEFDGKGFSGFTDLAGFDLRRGMRGRFDAGVSGSIYHAWESGIVDYGVGVDVGYNVATNVWVTLGYNFSGFHDEDFTAARFTAAGPYLRLSIKADQHTLKDIAGQR